MHRDTLRLPLELKLPLIEVFGTEYVSCTITASCWPSQPGLAYRDISDFQWELLQSSIVGTLDLILDVAADEVGVPPVVSSLSRLRRVGFRADGPGTQRTALAQAATVHPPQRQCFGDY
jgi:hypothetical protein